MYKCSGMFGGGAYNCGCKSYFLCGYVASENSKCAGEDVTIDVNRRVKYRTCIHIRATIILNTYVEYSTYMNLDERIYG